MADYPRYRQIAEELRAQIEAGELRPGSRLPSELDLRDRYNASRNTVRDAVKLLAGQRLIETRHGQGMFVAQRTTPLTLTVTVDPKDGLVGVEGQAAFTQIRRQGRHVSGSVPRVEVHNASEEIAEQLRVQAGSQVITRRQEWRVDGAPWALQLTTYPGTLGASAPALLVASDIETGAIAYIEESAGIAETGRRDLILQRQATGEEARFFALPDDAQVPVTVVVRTGYQATGAGLAPLRATTTVYLADRVRFVADSGIVPPVDGAPPPAN